MTSLIDVIFLLLLFFMLSSTFSRFSEIAFSAATGGALPEASVKPLFVQLTAETVRLNGVDIDLSGLAPALRALPPVDAPQPLLISLRGDVSSQRLTDLLVLLRDVSSVAPTVLGDAG